MAEENVQVEQTTPAATLEVKQTPVTEPAVDKSAEKKESSAKEADPITYESTGDAKLDVALAFFGKAGLGDQHPAIQAAITGDFSLLAAELEAKGMPGWQSHLNLAKESYEKYQSEQKAGQEKIVGAVSEALEKAGYSNEQWNEAVAWTRENAEPEEIEQINLMLRHPFTAKIAVGYLTSLHSEAHGVEKQPAKRGIKEEAGAERRAAADTTPISRAQFAQEAEKLARNFGPDYMSTPEYKALRQRIR